MLCQAKSHELALPGSKETFVLSTYDTCVGFVECFPYLVLIRNQEMKGFAIENKQNFSPYLDSDCHSGHGFHDNALFPLREFYSRPL